MGFLVEVDLVRPFATWKKKRFPLHFGAKYDWRLASADSLAKSFHVSSLSPSFPSNRVCWTLFNEQTDSHRRKDFQFVRRNVIKFNVFIVQVGGCAMRYSLLFVCSLRLVLFPCCSRAVSQLTRLPSTKTRLMQLLTGPVLAPVWQPAPRFALTPLANEVTNL